MLIFQCRIFEWGSKQILELWEIRGAISDSSLQISGKPKQKVRVKRASYRRGSPRRSKESKESKSEVNEKEEKEIQTVDPNEIEPALPKSLDVISAFGRPTRRVTVLRLKNRGDTRSPWTAWIFM